MLVPGYLVGLCCETDGGSTFLRNVGKEADYKLIQPRM
jgi:hypothetical protein